MSSHPEEEIESEIEEGEIVSDDEISLDMSEDDHEEILGDDGIDVAELLSSLMATPEGDTVCTALVNIAFQLQTQNKILVKMLSKMQNA
jgi:hypothetical protein|tara:strand:- start:2061 stop:2327 length:267 start_codon:yes stop_codon:yes gene_type:complete